MKKVISTLAITLMGTVAFATNGTTTLASKSDNAKLFELLKTYSCSITIKYGKNNSEGQATSNISQKDACNKAYQLAQLPLILLGTFN